MRKLFVSKYEGEQEMVARFRSWWQQIKQHRVAIGVGALLVAILVLIFVEVRLYGTGFTGKPLWDWMQLLIIPLVIAIGGYLFNMAVSRTEQQNTTENQREAALQAYIDKISELLLREHLGESPAPDKVVSIARARTATVLRTLDPVRRGSLIRFLSQAGILIKCTEKAMAGLDLHGADLSQLNLSSANLSAADLSGAFLIQSELSEALLIRAKLISEACLFEANLSGADLTGADLSRAFLYGANLTGADLSWAKLRDAKITQEQWEKAKSLKGTTMPDGSIHP